MKVFAAWEIPDDLRNVLLGHLDAFESAHPGCRLEVFVQATPAVSMVEILAEPTSSVAQILGRHGGPDGPRLSPFDRATAALRENPGGSARAIAKRIGVSHQTVMRAQEALRQATAAPAVQSNKNGPCGPERRRS
jgi:hypothetical protein